MLSPYIATRRLTISGVGPFYINIHNVTFGKRWTVPKIDPFLWTAGKVLVTREDWPIIYGE